MLAKFHQNDTVYC